MTFPERLAEEWEAILGTRPDNAFMGIRVGELRKVLTALREQQQLTKAQSHDLETAWDIKHERDEALLNVQAARVLVEEAEEDTQEALAQVAVLLALLQRVRDAEAPEEYLDDVERIEEDKDRLYTSARALLDRLDEADKCHDSLTEMLNDETAKCEAYESDNSRLEARLQRAEAVGEATRKYLDGDCTRAFAEDALAAWEEGKA